MKRIILIIGALLLGLVVRAQSVTYTCRYWFDQNHAQAVTTTFSTNGWEAELDVGDLTDGIHALHLNVLATDTVSVLGIENDSLYHAADTTLMKWSSPQSFLFMKVSATPSADLEYRYWFDQDYSAVQSGSVGNGFMLLDVAHLEEGLHVLHVMLKGTEYTAAQSYLFLKMDAWEQGTPNYVYHCWFDEDYANQQSDSLGGGHLLLDVNGLDEGMHSVHVMVEGSTLTATQNYLFMKVAPFSADTLDMTHLAYHCWFDQDFEHRVTDSLGNGNLLLDVGSLDEGIHSVHVLLEGSTLTATQSYLFMKIAVEDPTTELQYICWFDQDYSNVQTSLVGSGLVELDVADLPNGIHTVNVQLDNGTRTAPQTYLFYKQPLGGYGVARWEYWINDNWDDRSTTILPASVDTLDIVTLLPVGHPALRSSCFHFHPNGEEPYINAKNQISFRIWDAEMRFMDMTRFYVDEQVQQDIVVQVFERNTTETFAAPRDNQITWYKLDAVVGDSLSFVASKACTMQLFAPSGEEVFNVSGSESITLHGLHAWEDGTYYLAVHDQTGSGETVSVTYNWMAKYCVLALTPDKVGNRMGNRFSVDFIGNGFNYLENAMFVRDNDTVFLYQVVESSVSKTRLQFLIFDVIANGKYDFYLTFRDGEERETLSFVQAVEMEEPDQGEKLVTIKTPFMVANPYPVKVTVENTGNLDYVYIPFNIAFTWPTNLDSKRNRIDQINFADFSATMSLEADSVGYSFAHVTTNLLGMGKEGGIMFFWIPYLQANETRSFTLNFTSPEFIRFDLYAWVGDGYEYNLDFDTLVVNYGNRATPEAQNLLTASNVARLSGNVAQWVSGGGGVPHPANVAGGIASNSIKTGVALAGVQNALGHIQDKAVCDAYGITPDNPLYDDIMSLHPPIATPGEIRRGWVGEMFDRLLGLQQTCGDLSNPNPGTPCNVHIAHAFQSGDPNDIHGYLSESGSHYMRQEIQNVQYEIEFENDTTLATAAAHTIIVRDTLDGTKFDLNSLAARSITIGDKRMELNGEQTFAKTLDLRPELYVIAQVNQDYNPATGIVQWIIQSLDPMTMEPTDDPNQGVLPVNYYGNGVGFINYSIDIKEAFADGTTISNRAGIIFDQNDVILTPTWTNIVDAVKPNSHIEEVIPNADTLNFIFASEDNRSGVWYHTVYYRNASTEMEWKVKKTQIFENNYLLVNDELMTTEFLVMATDSAGNREEKEMLAEYIFVYDGPGQVTQADALAQGWNWWSTYIEQNGQDGLADLENSLGHNGLTIKSQSDFTDNFYQDMGVDYWYGSLESVQNEQGYLINVAQPCNTSLTGIATNPTNHPITIRPNWNWIGYPVASPQAVTSALVSFTPSPDDVLKGQSDFTSYYEGYGWYPDDFTLVPGQSYLYCSNATVNKTLTYSGVSRGGVMKLTKTEKRYWNNNVHAYADNYNVIAVVNIDGEEQRGENLELGAFVNGECRGSARLRYFALLDRYYAMLTITGQEDDKVEFRLIDTENLDRVEIGLNQLVFKKNTVVGRLGKPYEIYFGDNDMISDNMVMFPNPVERGHEFSLDIPHDETIIEIVITDVLGTQVRHEAGAVNAKSVKGLLAAGVYVIKAVAKSGTTYHGRLIVE